MNADDTPDWRQTYPNNRNKSSSIKIKTNNRKDPYNTNNPNNPNHQNNENNPSTSDNNKITPKPLTTLI